MIITSFHQDMQSTVCFDGATSNTFPVSSGVKQGCVLAPNLFRIFFSMLLQYAFVDCTEGVYVWTRSDSKLFNIARLHAKTKAYAVRIRRCFNFPQQGGPPTSCRQAVPHLQGVWANDQPQEGLPTSWRKVLCLPQSSPSTTWSWRLWTPSPTWAPPCQAPLCSMLRSASGSPKQLLSWPNSTSKCGAMTC